MNLYGNNEAKVHVVGVNHFVFIRTEGFTRASETNKQMKWQTPFSLLKGIAGKLVKNLSNEHKKQHNSPSWTKRIKSLSRNFRSLGTHFSRHLRKLE